MSGPSPDPRGLFEAHHDRVRNIIASICRRNLWLGDDADDFGQWAQLRLIENDHALLGAFEGRASIATFLTVVLHNLFRDYRNQQLGRWRPSAAARRLGPVGVQLDTLIHRDGRTLEDATQILRRNHGVPLSAAALSAMAASLPPHYPRRSQDAGEIDRRAAPEQADGRWFDAERAASTRRAREALDAALNALEPEDRLVMKLRFFEDFEVSRIARHLRREQGPLYRRIDRLLVVLKRRLEAAGLTGEDINGLLGQDPAEDTGPSASDRNASSTSGSQA